MPGENITILESRPVFGGDLDGADFTGKGWVITGGREMDDHFECMWDLFKDIPSHDDPNVSILDAYKRLNEEDSNYFLCRVIHNCGQDAGFDITFKVSNRGQREISKLMFTKNEDLYSRSIDEFFDDEVFSFNFWYYFKTMFAFKNEHSALEVKLYMQRFIHHLEGFSDLSALRFCKYNNYDSIAVPMVNYLKKAGVKSLLETAAENVVFDIRSGEKTAARVDYTQEGELKSQKIDRNTLAFFTAGSNTDGTTIGDHHTAPEFNTGITSLWPVWQKIAAQDPSFGRPDELLSDPELTQW